MKMNRLKHLKEQRAAKEARMKAIMDLCATENRNRKTEEKTEWDTLKGEVDAMRDEISALEEQEAIDARSAKPVVKVEATIAGKDEEVPSLRGQLKKWAEANKSSIEAIKSGEMRSLSPLELRVPFTMTVAAVNSGSSVYLPNSGAIQGSVNDLNRVQPTFWDRLTKGRTRLNPYVWVNKTNKQGSADFIGEGVLKPLVSFELTTETSVPKKVAERMRVSTELLYDIDGMQSLIENEIRYEIRKHANDAVLTATASSTDPAGVTTLASAFTLTTIEAGGTPTYVDAIRAAIAQLQSLNYTTNIVAFVNPIDAANMDLSKSADDGHYLLPPFVSQSGLLVAGVPVVVDNNIAVGNLLIGDMSKYKILMYEDLTIKWGLDSDDFSKNLVTVIGEMRFHQFFGANDTGAFIYDSFADIVAAITTT